MRKRNLRILNIDGVEGVGKTTQLNIMANYLKNLNMPVQMNKIVDSDESLKIAIDRTEKFLNEHEDGIVLNDGTIAKAMVVQLSTGSRYQDIEDRYKDLLFRLQVLDHSHGMVNVLVVPDNLDSCDARLRKRQGLFGEEITGIIDSIMQQTLMKGFADFDNSVLSRNLKFQVLKAYNDESIMQVHKNLLQLLTDSFEIKKGL